jgi:hypothetical protein
MRVQWPYICQSRRSGQRFPDYARLPLLENRWTMPLAAMMVVIAGADG